MLWQPTLTLGVSWLGNGRGMSGVCLGTARQAGPGLDPPSVSDPGWGT